MPEMLAIEGWEFWTTVAAETRGARQERHLRHSGAGDTDADFVERLRNGDMDALEGLYLQHATRMKSVAANLLGNPGDAEDAVQEAFVRIHRGISGFRDESTFGTWSYRVLVNVCHDLIRKRRRNPETAAVSEEAIAFHRPVAAGDHPLRVALEKALRELNPRLRSAFVLFEVEGFKHREIAEILQTSEGNSKQMVYSAKRQLRRLLWTGPSRKGRP